MKKKDKENLNIIEDTEEITDIIVNRALEEFDEEDGTLEEMEERVRQHKRRFRIKVLLIISAFLFVSVGSFLLIYLQTYTEVRVVDTRKSSDSDNNNYRQFADGVLKYSRDGVALLNRKGEEVWNQPYQIKSPMVETYKESGAIADKGGNDVVVFDKKGWRGEIHTDYPIEKIAVSARGIVSMILKNENSPKIVCYDAAGNLIRQTYQDDGWDFAFDYNYNAQNQLVSVKTSYADGTSYLEKYTYDAAGNLTEQVNTGSDGFTSTTRYTYNARGDMLTIRYSDSDGWTYTTEYTYDAAGRMTRYSNRDSEYGDTLETYVYDAAGNCLENTYSNTCDGVTWSYSYKYTYDAGNRLIREVGTETDGTVTTTEYTYDAEGRPVTVSETSGGTTTTYAITYDLGNNIIRVVSTAPGVSNEMKFEYDKHGNMILEDYGLGNITRTEYIAIKK